MPTFSIKTLGCKVNQYESQLIRENFLRNGFNEVNGKKLADIYVINTCTVTGHADSESRHLIRNAHRINPNAKIVVTGCFAEKDANIISKIEGVTDIIKNSDKDKLLQFVIHRPKPVTHNFITGFKEHTKAFVKIQDGCDNFCSFCKVPLVRGRSKSRPIEDIKNEVSKLINNGFKEIVLTGICLGEWGRDINDGLKLADVIEELEGLGNNFRIRLSSIELKYVSKKLLDKIFSSDKVCKHLHIPLQSGDDYILKMMNRPYTRDDYLSGVKEIRRAIPKIGITTDVLIGFPGEEESHFKNTLNIIKKSKPHRIHVFTYSKREGTKAAELEESPPSFIIKDRAERLRKITRKLSYEYRKQFLKKEEKVLVESKRDKLTQLLTGYTDTYIKVLLDGEDSLKSALLKCKVCKVTKDHTFVMPQKSRPPS